MRVFFVSHWLTLVIGQNVLNDVEIGGLFSRFGLIPFVDRRDMDIDVVVVVDIVSVFLLEFAPYFGL